MSLDGTARRRWFGAAVLLAAIGMLTLGQTVLRERLGPVGFVVYWLLCLILTSVAILIAFLDLRALHDHSRKEQRDLLETTLKKIQDEARNRPHPPRNRPL